MNETTTPRAFTPSEAVALYRLRIEERYKTPLESPHSRPGVHRGEQRERVSLLVERETGISRSLLMRAQAVVCAAERDPARFGDLLAKLDNGTSITSAYEEMQSRRPKLAQDRRRHPFVRKLRRRKPNREVERAVWALAGICTVLETLELERLQREKREEWSRELRRSARVINVFARRMLNDEIKTAE